MKIAMVGAGMIAIPPPGYGAVEKHIWNLSEQLRALGHDVEIINRVFGEESANEYRFGVWARRQVKRADADVVHLHTPGVANVLHTLGVKDFVFTTHTRHWAGAHKLGEKVGFALEKRAIEKAREVIAVSRFVADQIERPTHVIPNGVDVARYRPAWDARDGRTVIGLGEVAEHKKWHLAAAAAHQVGARFRLVGPIRDPAYAERVERAGEGAVEIAGPMDENDLIAALASADVMVHPSVSESFGMAVVEGMASGLPVVVSDMLRFLVEPRVEGFHVRTDGSDEARTAAIAERLGVLLGDEALRRRMGQAARARAERDFSWRSVAERVAAVYARA